MYRTLLFGFLTFGSTFLQSQPSYSDSLAVSISATTDFAKNIYYLQRGNEAAIYSGILHYRYSSDIGGIAYYRSENWQRGEVIYENTLYKNVLMKYDLVKDQLIVISNDTSGVSIGLFSPRVKQFFLSGSTFIRVDNNNGGSLQSGFYRQLAVGKVIAFARVKKIISEKIIDNKVARNFDENIKYYVLKEEKYFHIQNKNDLLTALKDHKKEIQGFMKKNKFKYRKEPEKTIVSLVDFFNQL
ncbi:MAG TPA: hypothetical protein VJ765_01035 [Chitinophagaceae bacterium]|nr:hypothetical protein [Chitinophagaceae bacterium]